MKASELRIGNYVLHRGKIKATNIEIIDDARVVSEILVEEIPLTEEWLVKLGFKENAFGFGLDRFPTYIKGDGDFFEPAHSDDYHFPDLEYVHQLQNLYFALTGEELTIK